MRKEPMPLDQLFELFEYNATTGCLYWKPRPIETFSAPGPGVSWNVRMAGNRAGSLQTNGYRAIRMASVRLSEHRVCWALHHNQWPEMIVDHVNGIKDDNRICNLRLASVHQNAQNKKVAYGTSRFKGVSYSARQKKWGAGLRKDGKTVFHRWMNSEIEAAKAYDEVAKEVFGEFAYLNFPDESHPRAATPAIGMEITPPAHVVAQIGGGK